MPKECEVLLYKEDIGEVNNILEVIDKRKSVREYAIILHDLDVEENGDLKKPHYHIFLNFGDTNWKFEYIAKWFNIPAQFVGKIKTNKPLTLRYFTHENCPNKHPYSVYDIVANFDVKALLEKESQKVTLNQLIKQCADGTITPRNYPDHIPAVLYAKHRSKFQAAWEYYNRQYDNAHDSKRDIPVIWVHGPSNAGKTTSCFLFAEERGLSAYKTSTGKDPFSFYNDEEVVVIDDVRANTSMPFNEFVQTIDPHYGSGIASRYSDVVLRKCSMIFITSIYSPVEIFQQYNLDAKDSAVQLYRRLSQVWHVQKDTIEITRYDVDKHEFCFIDRVKNPVPAYVEAQKAKNAATAPTMDTRFIFKQIRDKYETQTSLFPDEEAATPESVDTNTPPNDEKEALPF